MPTPPSITQGLTKPAKSAVTLARITGWSLSVNRKRTMIEMHAPGADHKVVVPYGSVNAHRVDSILRQVIRHTPQSELASVLYGNYDMRSDPDAAELVTTLGPVLVKTVLDTAETWDELHPDFREKFIPPGHAARRLPGGPDHVRALPPPPEDDIHTDGDYTEVKYVGDAADKADLWVRVYPGGEFEYLCRDHDEVVVLKSIQAVSAHIGHHHSEPRINVAPPVEVPADEAAPNERNEAGEWVCPECGRTFGRTQSLGLHRRRAHGVEGASPAAREYREKVAASAQPIETVSATVPEPKPEAEAEPEPKRMTGPQIAERIHGEVVARVHWAARQTGQPGRQGKMYQSRAVDQVTYADGHVGYLCQHCDEYASDNPRSVSAHAAQAHPGASDSSEQVQFVVPEYEASGIKRPKDTRLQHMITDALDTIGDWQAMTPTELAEAIAEFVAENRPDYVPHDPLTDAEVLERIVRLVDRGQYAHLQTAVGDLSHQLADMAAQVEMATQDIAELEKDRDEAIAQRQALISERQALRDMLEVIPHGVMPQ